MVLVADRGRMAVCLWSKGSRSRGSIAGSVEESGPAPAGRDVDVSIEESVLTVAGSRNFYADKTAEGFRRVERSFGTFRRSVRLPDRVDPDAVTAAYKDGLLTVTVPKAESAKPRRIQVASA